MKERLCVYFRTHVHQQMSCMFALYRVKRDVFLFFRGDFVLVFLFQVFGFRSPIKLKPQNKCKDPSVSMCGCMSTCLHVSMFD